MEYASYIRRCKRIVPREFLHCAETFTEKKYRRRFKIDFISVDGEKVPEIQFPIRNPRNAIFFLGIDRFSVGGGKPSKRFDIFFRG